MNTYFSGDYLKAQLLLRQARNPRYSLRAFARRLGISPAYVSRVISGKCTLSVQAAHRVIQNMPVPSDEAQLILAESVALRAGPSIGRAATLNSQRA